MLIKWKLKKKKKKSVGKIKSAETVPNEIE